MRALTSYGAYKQIAYVDLRNCTIYSLQKEELNPVCIEDAELIYLARDRFIRENRREEFVEFYQLLKEGYMHEARHIIES
jgi:hypothetical protein